MESDKHERDSNLRLPDTADSGVDDNAIMKWWINASWESNSGPHDPEDSIISTRPTDLICLDLVWER